MTEVKNTLDKISDKLDMAKEKISELKTQQQEVYKVKHREKTEKGNQYTVGQLKWPKIYVIGVCERERGRRSV